MLTSQQLAEGYDTDIRRISENFQRNRERYVEGIHYFKLEGDEKRDFCNHTQIADSLKNAVWVYLWTERGAFHHAKSLNTDRAWEVYDSLVENYFKSKELKEYIESEKLSPQTQLLLQLSQSIAKAEMERQEIKAIALEAKTGFEQAKEKINEIKDTMANLPKDQWRKWVNSSMAAIVMKRQELGHDLGKKPYEFVKAESYKLLDEQGFDVYRRVENQKARLLLAGVSKTKAEEVNPIQIIESDPKMRKIYDSIVKEMRIKYLV